MKKNDLISLLLIGIVAIPFTGCGTPKPQFNQSNKGIAFQNGKPYAVPYGSTYSYINKFQLDVMNKLATPNKEADASAKKGGFEELAKMTYKGSNIAIQQCKLGDVMWVAPSAIEKAGDNRFGQLMYSMAAFNTGQARCVKPLSKQEYEYYLNKENQDRQSMMNAQLQQQKQSSELAKQMQETGLRMQEMYTPKTYNVNVYHY